MELNDLMADMIEHPMEPRLKPSVRFFKTIEGRCWYVATDGRQQADGAMWHCYGNSFGLCSQRLKEHLKNA
jgi:hypothetical protein